jgi:hypothetical protein
MKRKLQTQDDNGDKMKKIKEKSGVRMNKQV